MDQKQTRKVEKLDYIDGLKVCACMMIFNFHFINAFYAGFYSLRPEEYHLPALEYFVGSSPLNLIMGGKFGVRMFMTISGFFVGYRFFLREKVSDLRCAEEIPASCLSHRHCELCNLPADEVWDVYQRSGFTACRNGGVLW